MTASTTHERLETAALTVAGSDSCGGAGIQADLATFAAHRVHGASAVTALTAQNTLGVTAVEAVPPAMVAAQIAAVLEDLPVRAAKTGMLPDAAVVRAVDAAWEGAGARAPRLVVDPVLVATSGAALAAGDTLPALRALMARAALVTPNLAEAGALTGIDVRSIDDARAAGRRLLETGCGAVLVKGGHGEEAMLSDLLLHAGGERVFRHAARPGRYHGTGCTLAAAVTAHLALGAGLETAVERAIAYVQGAMAAGRLPRAGELVLLGHAAAAEGAGVSPGAR